jgi:hypothetical protein
MFYIKLLIPVFSPPTIDYTVIAAGPPRAVAGIRLPSLSLIIGTSFFLRNFSFSIWARFSTSGSTKSNPDSSSSSDYF